MKCIVFRNLYCRYFWILLKPVWITTPDWGCWSTVQFRNQSTTYSNTIEKPWLIVCDLTVKAELQVTPLGQISLCQVSFSKALVCSNHYFANDHSANLSSIIWQVGNQSAKCHLAKRNINLLRISLLNVIRSSVVEPISEFAKKTVWLTISPLPLRFRVDPSFCLKYVG